MASEVEGEKGNSEVLEAQTALPGGEGEKGSNEDFLKAQIAFRCAKAAFLLLSLKSGRIHAPDFEDEEKERLQKVAADLRIELLRERFKNRKMKLCSLAEATLQILVLLSAIMFCLILCFA